MGDNSGDEAFQSINDSIDVTQFADLQAKGRDRPRLT